MNVTTEIHTSDLIEPCARKVLLRREGKLIGEMPTALYRGNLNHEAARLWHQKGKPDRHSCERIVLEASRRTDAKAAMERRTITPAVEKAKPDLLAEATNLLFQYAGRVAPTMDGARWLGCELPLRVTLDIDGEPQDFATHLDCLWRRADRLVVWDYKTGEDAPTDAYLGRNLQFILFWLGVRHGAAQIGEEWVEFDEWPELFWIHWNNLAPYGRGGSVTNHQTGEVREWKKGDLRPLEFAIVPANLKPEREADAIELIADRVRMQRANLWPVNPDPIACFLCESRGWCPSISRGGEHDDGE